MSRRADRRTKSPAFERLPAVPERSCVTWRRWGPALLHAIGITGEDGEGFDLRRRLGDLGCGTQHLHAVADRMTPTYLKPRNMHDASLAGEHDRYDTKNRTETSAATEQLIIQSIDAILPEVDALMIMDQVEETNRGVVTDRVREAIISRAPQHPDVIFWADSRRRISKISPRHD